MTGAGALPLPTKQPPRLKPATTKANASATFFILAPLWELNFNGLIEAPSQHAL
jgi:hypothetical protein